MQKHTLGHCLFPFYFVLSISMILLTSSCCMPAPNDISPSEAVNGFGNEGSRWILVRICPLYGVENLRQKDYLIFRRTGQQNWILKNKNCYTKHVRSWRGKYSREIFLFRDVDFKVEEVPDVVKYGACKFGSNDFYFVDIDSIQKLLPEIEMLVLDDGKYGFTVATLNEELWTAKEGASFKFGAGYVRKEGMTLTEMLSAKERSRYK